jgi:hypothetical protein
VTRRACVRAETRDLDPGRRDPGKPLTAIVPRDNGSPRRAPGDRRPAASDHRVQLAIWPFSRSTPGRPRTPDLWLRRPDTDGCTEVHDGANGRYWSVLNARDARRYVTAAWSVDMLVVVSWRIRATMRTALGPALFVSVLVGCSQSSSSEFPSCSASQACSVTSHGAACFQDCIDDAGSCPAGLVCTGGSACCTGAACSAPIIRVCCPPSGC